MNPPKFRESASATFPPRLSLRAFKRYLVAFGTVAAATFVRWAVTDQMADRSPHLPFIVAVVATAWLCGTWPALFAMALGAVAAEVFFLRPFGHFDADIQSTLGLAFYLLASLFCILTSTLLDRSRAEALLAAAAAERRRQLLEQALAERQAAEQKLNENRFWLSLAERSGRIGVWSRDLRTGQFVGSDSLSELFGEALPSGPVNARNFHGLVHPEDIDRVRDAVQKAIATGGEYEVEFRVRGNDGQDRWVSERGQRFVDPIHNTTRLSGVMMDITSRKQTEAGARELRAALIDFQAGEAKRIESELERVRMQLVRQTRFAAIGQFSASIAHDLRNPLGVIRNAVYLLRRRLAKSGQKLDLLTMIEDEVVAADAIITNMMEMTRGREPDRKDVDLATLLTEVTGRIDSSGRIGWRIELSDDPLTIWCDANQFRQVLNNLLRNAVEAMNGRGNITFTARHIDESDCIDIRDTGPGISAEILPQLFEPLATDKKRGTGLGLMICKQIVERHGGTIALLDDGEPGAAFRITIPRRPQDRTEATGHG